jgi:hypothetical protein
MESCYQTAAILHGLYSPFWPLSIVSFSRWILEVGDWVDITTMHLSIPAWASTDSTVWPVYAANLRDPKSQFRLCVMNVGTMSRDRICPHTAIMQEGIFVEWILIKFWVSCCALGFCLFAGFFSSGVTSWFRFWSECSNVECLRLIGRRDFQMIGGT